MIPRNRLEGIIRHFKKTAVLVVGDLMMDKFVWGKVSRISPEAPVPVVEVTRESYMPGGAGNVVNNLCSMGSKVLVSGVIGNDRIGEQLVGALSARTAETRGVFVDQSRPTILKTRIIAHHQQVVRFDKEVKEPIKGELLDNIINYIKESLPRVNALILSDYGKGVITRPLLHKAIRMARQSHTPITVDPKVEHFFQYKGVTCITPNHQETGQALHKALPDQTSLVEAGKKILKRLNSQALLITQGEQGMTLFEKNGKVTHIPTMAREVFDVTGAGDTVISVFTLALACGAKIIEAAHLANYAAGIVVGKLGTATTTPEELMDRIKER